MKKINEEFLVNFMITIVAFLLYLLALNALLSFLFWPSETLVWYDYLVEIIAYTTLGSLIVLKRKSLLKKIVN